MASAACSAACMEENSPSVRPPAASTRSGNLEEQLVGQAGSALAAAGAPRRRESLAAHSRTATRRRVPSTSGASSPMQPEGARHGVERAAERQRRAGQHGRTVGEELVAQQPGHRQRRAPQRRRAPLGGRRPDHVVLAPPPRPGRRSPRPPRRRPWPARGRPARRRPPPYRRDALSPPTFVTVACPASRTATSASNSPPPSCSTRPGSTSARASRGTPAAVSRSSTVSAARACVRAAPRARPCRR